MTCECPDDIRVGTIGLQFIATIKEKNVRGECVVVDVSAATNMYLRFNNPNGVGVQKTASLYTDGKDGKITWTTTLSGDIDVVGDWEVEGVVEIAGGTFYSDIETFRAKRVIEVP